MIPGEYHVKPGQIALNTGRATCRVVVENHGDRPIQVGSHYHFAEVNPALKFNRQQATGYRLNIPAGTAVRFEPARNARLSWWPSPVTAPFSASAARSWALWRQTMSNISRRAYADMFGPTIGDKVRPADTELWIEVEDDLTTYGKRSNSAAAK